MITPLILALALAPDPPSQPDPQVCAGTCVSDPDMIKIVEVLRERKCLYEQEPVFDLDPLTVVLDQQGRVYYSGAEPKPYTIHMRWCNFDVKAEGRVRMVAAVQEPPAYDFRFRPKAYVGYMLAEPFRAGREAEQGIDSGLMLDLFYVHDFNFNAHVGFRAVGAGLGVDILKSFGGYVGYSYSWDGQSSPETSLWFAFW